MSIDTGNLGGKSKKQLIERVEKLAAENAILKEIQLYMEATNKKIEKLEKEQNKSLQYLRRDSVEIAFIPVQIQYEDLEEEVVSIYGEAGVEVHVMKLSLSDIQACHRIDMKLSLSDIQAFHRIGMKLSLSDIQACHRIGMKLSLSDIQACHRIGMKLSLSERQSCHRIGMKLSLSDIQACHRIGMKLSLSDIQACHRIGMKLSLSDIQACHRIGMKLSLSDIQACHRIGKQKITIVKFTNRKFARA